jgi:hypothetical protein
MNNVTGGQSATLYYVPYVSDTIALYTGTTWRNYTFSTMSLASATYMPLRTQAYTNDPAAGSNIVLNMTNTGGFLVGDTVIVSSSAGTDLPTTITAVVANTSITVASLTFDHTTTSPLVKNIMCYDIFASYSGGNVVLTALAWADTKTRATALVRQNGVLCKTGELTSRYLGTVCNAIFGGTSYIYDSSDRRNVWNYYNRVDGSLFGKQTANSWPYTVATWRAPNNVIDFGETRVGAVTGVIEDMVTITATGLTTNTSATPVSVAHGIGINSVTSNSAKLFGHMASTAGQLGTSIFSGTLPLGFAYIQKLEYSVATGVTTWYGDNNTTAVMSAGLIGTVRY